MGSIYSDPIDALEKGDIVAMGGHVGIYYPLSNGSNGTISASTKYEEVVHNDWGFRSGDNPTIWRCDCDMNP